jgi:hypothetical protein
VGCGNFEVKMMKNPIEMIYLDEILGLCAIADSELLLLMKYIIEISFLLIWSLTHSQELASFKLSECDAGSNIDLLRRRIISKELSADTLRINIGFIENCCLSPKPSIKNSNDTLYLSMENSSDIWCACDCCFEMTLVISNIADTNFTLMWGEYEVKAQSKYPKLPHEYIFNSNTPTNQLNDRDIKVGLWYKYSDQSPGRKYEIFYDETPDEKAVTKWIRVYNKDGELMEISIMKGRNGDSVIFEPEEYNRVFVR